MLALNIKPTHKPIKNYYTELKEYTKIGVEHEGAVRTAFQNLLQHYCRRTDLILVCEKTHYTPEKRRIRIDGEVVDAFDLPHGHWEAKDTHDDLPTEARKKAEAGYPFKNITFQSPNRAEDPEYILRLIGQIITVSLETMDIVNRLPALK